jgi:hypothetical protein
MQLGWERENAYRIMVGNPLGKLPLVILRRKLEGDINMGLREIICKH